MREDFETNQDTPEEQEWSIDALFEPNLLRLAFAHLPENLPEVSEERLQNVLARCGFDVLGKEDSLVPYQAEQNSIEQQKTSFPQPSLGKKLKEIICSVMFIPQSGLVQCATKSIKRTKDSPNTNDDYATLELYQDNEGTWQVSFETDNPKFDSEKEVLIIITDSMGGEVVRKKRLKYRDDVWQFNEPLQNLLEEEYKSTQKHTLTIKYYTKDEDE